jgi:hypothetical protein
MASEGRTARKLQGISFSSPPAHESPIGVEWWGFIGRASKFRAVVQRYLESVRQFLFAFEASFSANAGANRWRIPDLAVSHRPRGPLPARISQGSRRETPPNGIACKAREGFQDSRYADIP